MLIGYAAQPRSTALPGTARFSPYTEALLDLIDNPGLRIVDLMHQIRTRVLAATNMKQEPWYQASMSGRFYFKSPPVAVGGGDAETPATGDRDSGPSAEQIMVWNGIKDSGNPADFETFLKAYPDSPFGPFAQTRLEALGDAQTASLTPPAAGIEVDEMDATYIVERTANLRADPSTAHDTVGQAQRESTLSVTGKVKGANWYRIARADGSTAYVFGDLISTVDPADIALWDRIRDSTDGKDFEVYLARFPDGRHAARAKRLPAALKPKVAAVTPPPPRAGAPSPATPAVGVFPKPRKAGDTFKDCADCPEMVVVPPGRFQMGSPSHESGRQDDEGPVHGVRIGYSLAVGKYEVTRGQFAVFVQDTGHGLSGGCWIWNGSKWAEDSGKSWRDPGYRQDDNHPVVCVNWKDAKAYVEWLSRKTGQTYRLLSEAEWEHAARAGTTTARHWGNDADQACDHANVHDEVSKRENKYSWEAHACDDSHAKTSPVGSFRSNAFGLHDVLGNVWEWTEDCWHDSYADAPSDGRAWTSGGGCGRRVLRGGSWNVSPRVVRSASRGWLGSDYRINYLGFRVARTLP